MLYAILKVILFAHILQCYDAQYTRYCSLKDDHWINNVEVNVTKADFHTTNINMDDQNNPIVDLFVDIEWELWPEEEIDGFMISLTNSGTFAPTTLQPMVEDDNCTFTNSYIYLSTVNTTDCPHVDQSCISSCRCNRNDCEIVNETECRGTKYQMKRFNSGYPFTVPSNTRSLQFKVDFSVPYRLSIVPYYRQYHATSLNNQQIIQADYCPEVISKEDIYSLDHAAEICCRMGYTDNLLRRIEFSQASPDFNEGTFNLTMSFQNLFHNETNLNLIIPNIDSGDAFYTYAQHGDIEEFGPPKLNFSSDLEPRCIKPSQYSVEIFSLRHTLSYNLIAQHSGDCYPCFQETMLPFDDIDTCDKRWAYCVDGELCFSGVNSTTLISNTSCACPPGYEGTGINPEFSEIGGCFEIKSCFENACAENAVCNDFSPPEVGYNCTCKSGHYGDGYIEGTGCRSKTVLALAIALPLIAFLLIIFAFVSWKIVSERRRQRDQMFSVFEVDVENGILNSFNDEENDKISSYDGPWKPTFGDKWELGRDCIVLGEVIGRGNYGIVYKSTCSSIKSDEEDAFAYTNYEYGGDTKNGNIYYERTDTEIVAVKAMQDCQLSHANLAEFLAEIGFLINVGSHDNIISIKGCCTTEKPVYLVTEYFKYGNLLHFLWNARDPANGITDPIYNVTETSLLNMAMCVAKGMEHLSKLRIIHGDIAARNILVDENGICKISDFGLANDVYRYGNLKGHSERCVPFKWISPERMSGGKLPITYKSDVWSFGILLYEMFTLGCAPFSNIDSDKLFKKLADGYIMQQPVSCTDEVYEVMKKCWKWRPSSRPSFTQIIKTVDVILNNMQDAKVIVNKEIEILDQEAYREEMAKLKAQRVNSTDEGFEENNYSSAGSNTDVSIAYNSVVSDSGQEEVISKCDVEL